MATVKKPTALPVSFEQFKKNPVAAVAFCMLAAVSYLYLDLKSGYKDQIENLNKKLDLYDAKVELVGRESFAKFECSVILYALDTSWREHLAALDHLRQGIHLRGYAQKDPKQEYKTESFNLFSLSI